MGQLGARSFAISTFVGEYRPRMIFRSKYKARSKTGMCLANTRKTRCGARLEANFKKSRKPTVAALKGGTRFHLPRPLAPDRLSGWPDITIRQCGVASLKLPLFAAAAAKRGRILITLHASTPGATGNAPDFLVQKEKTQPILCAISKTIRIIFA